MSSTSADSPKRIDSDQKQQQDCQQEDFIASASFTGARADYVFTTGDKGTGYYKDVPLRLRQKPAAKAKPAVLKSNSLVKGLQRKPANLPDAKKQKTEPASKPAYLKEMDRYRAMSCSSNTQHDRPLVK